MSNVSIDPRIKACADGTYEFVEFEPPTLKRRFTAVGMTDDYSTAVSRATLDSISFERAFKDLVRRVSELEQMVQDNALYFESCEELYAEEWRET